MATTAQQRSRAGRAAQTPAQDGGPAREQAHELTITIPLDRAAELIAAPITAAGRVLSSSRGGLPVYVGLGVMAVADVLEWPVAAAAGLGYAVLRRWGPLRPLRVPPAAGRGEPGQPAVDR